LEDPPLPCPPARPGFSRSRTSTGRQAPSRQHTPHRPPQHLVGSRRELPCLLAGLRADERGATSRQSPSHAKAQWRFDCRLLNHRCGGSVGFRARGSHRLPV